ncbi:MAG: hypothetical protein ACJ731_13805 [Vicinamibacterales bacterium]
MTAAEIQLENDRVRIGDRLAISFQRTLRVPDDGRPYPLPPGLGRFPVRRAADYADRIPRAWHGDFLIPMYRREALWIGFEGASWKPNAVKVAVGGVDAVSGKGWSDELSERPQNYVVVPDQPWLDGINSGKKTVRQFVAMPIGEGFSVEAQVTGAEAMGGIQLVAFEPKPGRFPDEPPANSGHDFDRLAMLAAPQTMGIAAGGKLEQAIYPDRYGIDCWDPEQASTLVVRLIAAREWPAITGEKPPPSPIDAATYTAAGLPWFELYDEQAGDLAPPETLARIKSIRELERDAPEKGINVDDSQVRKLRR